MATFVVTSDAAGGAGSLRDALALAEANRGPDVIEFAAGLGSVKIDRTLAVYSDVTINGDRNGDGTADVSLTMTGSSVASDAISVASSAKLALNGIAVDGFRIDGTGFGGSASFIENHGALSISNSSFNGIKAYGAYGGDENGDLGRDAGSGGSAAGVVLNYGQLSVTDSIFGDNLASAGSGGNAETYIGGYGGSAAAGILHLSSGTLTISGVTVTGGQAYAGNAGSSGPGWEDFAPLGGLAGAFYYASSGTVEADWSLQPATSMTAIGGFPSPSGYVSGIAVARGSEGADVIRDYSGAGVIDGRGGDDRLVGGEAHGGDGNDTIAGAPGDSSLFGGAGNDRLIASAGADDIYGGDGVDELDFSAFAVGVVAALPTGGAFAGGKFALHEDIENLRGSSFADRLTGSDEANSIFGGAGDDRLAGGGGDDRLDGESGADAMAGGIGNDTYYVDSSVDRVIELDGAGTDTVLARASFSIHGEVENLTLLGAAAIDGSGSGIVNRIVGNAAANVLDGRAGADVLYGNGGADTFQFTTRLSAANVDRIMDFNVADDTIELSQSMFSALSVGGLPANAFHDGAAAHDASDRIIYDGATGKLLYDPDGIGGRAATQFAALSKGLAVTELDFFVV